MISDVYFPRVNGVSTSIQTFRFDLAAQGCESLLVAPAYPRRDSGEDNVTRVPSRYLVFDPEDRAMVYRKLKRQCLALRDRFDLIHVHTPFFAHYAGVWLGRELDIRVVETCHTYFEHYFHHYLPLVPRKLLGNLARSITRRQMNAVDCVVAPTTQMADALYDYGVTTDVQVIPTGVDMNRLSDGDGARFRQAHGIDPGRPLLLNVGRVAHEKNLDFLLDVVTRVRRQVTDVLLVIAGEGPAQSSLQSRVNREGLTNNVRFVGYLDRDSELLDCYRSADLFVFASRTETQGMVLLEAMAQEVPVVSTAVMGTKSVLQNAGGAFVVREEVAAFASAITTLLGDDDLRREMATEARRYVDEHWSSGEMAQRMITLYRQTLAKRGQAIPSSRRSGTTHNGMAI